MKHFKIFFALVVVVLLFTNCDPNDSSITSQNDDTFAENFGATASRDFIGQVVDIDNVPLQNVSIKIGTSTVQTDVNGVFIINGASVHERFAYITAKKTGYIDGSRAMVPTNGKNNVKIMLLPNAPIETIQSGETSEVSIYSGTKVVFDGSFQDENGAAYTGAVQVAMFHLTPSDENIDKLMPGMLYAQTQSNEEAVLETFGMLNVELRGSAGQKLNLATGHTAEITIRIDDSQQATAPSTIPLWHFDESKGYWKEDGVATKVGNKYVGEVSHFSWWNCDTFESVVSLTVTVVDANGNTISNVGVGLTVSSNNFNSYEQYTDNNGQVSGLIPANQTLILNVYGQCGVIYTTTIGPFSTNTILPNVVLSSITVLSSNVVGTLVKCDNTNVTNGYVILNKLDDFSIFPVTNGAFSFNEIYCSSNTQFSLKGVDYDNLQSTGYINYNATSSITNVGYLVACGTIDEFISYKFDNQQFFIAENLFLDQNGSSSPLHLDGFYQTSAGSQVYFGLYLGDYSLGAHHSDNIGFQIDMHVGGVNFNTGSNIDILFNVNKYGEVGDYVDIYLDGSYNDGAGNPHTVSATIHMLRDN